MAVPVSQMLRVAAHVLRHKLRGDARYPLVLMLEPLYRCNLACAGCGKIQYPKNILRHQLSVEECLAAADECDTPMVAIPGGEPLLHPQIGEIVAGLVARRKYVYLCTNALLLEEKLGLFQPSRYLSFSVHLDGLEEEHDRAVCRPGTYGKAVAAIRAALAAGFRVTTNTTLFEGADAERARDFFDQAMRLGVEGMMLSPGYPYQKAPDQEHFLRREGTVELFRRIFDTKRRRRWRFNQSPLFLEFLLGTREYDCTPWGMPCYGVFGWQRPCYLLQEGYAASYRELLETTAWERYGHASGNPACRDCMMHSGFEASSVDEAFSSLRGLLQMARASLFGPRTARPAPLRCARTEAPAPAPVAARAAAAAVALPARAAAATPEVLREAFDHRGDVTLVLRDGEKVEGYVANLEERELLVWLRRTTEKRRIPADAVAEVRFPGAS
jgi:hopanoid biosynthesis associated radical SAM protein HpnH